MPPWGGGRGSAKREAAPHGSLIISLATAAAKLSVGGFFFSALGGGFLLASPLKSGVLLEKGLLIPSQGPPLPAWGPWVPHREPVQAQARQTKHMLQMPARRRHQNKLKRYLRQSFNVVII